MLEFAVHYVDGPLAGHGTVVQPDDAVDGPPLVQRLPLPSTERGVRQTMTAAGTGGNHAIYERRGRNETTGEWEFALVRVE